MGRASGGVAGPPSGGRVSSTQGDSSPLASSAENQECIKSTDLLGPQSVAPCNGPQNSSTAFDLDDERFGTAFGNLGAIPAGAAGNLGQALNRMSAGNAKGARGELRNLGNTGPSLATSIKANLDLISKKFPKKKIDERMANLEKLYGGRIQNAIRSAGLKAPALAASPLSFATLASLGAPPEQKGNESGVPKDVNALKKGEFGRR